MTERYTDSELKDIFCSAMRNGLRNSPMDVENVFNPSNFTSLQNAINNTILKEWSTKEEILQFIQYEISNRITNVSNALYIIRAMSNALYIAPWNPISK